MSHSLNILVIGGSRNIGYFSAIRLLASGATVTFLLRSPSVFDQDTAIQQYVKSGKAQLLKGDALVQDDVQRAWDQAGSGGIVDLLLFTVGGVPKFTFLKGFVISPTNLATQCLINALCTMPRTSPPPRVIAMSSTGLTRASHANLPLLLKPLYGYLLTVPHKDKLGLERVVAHCAGWSWNAKDDGEPVEDLVGPDWTKLEGLPAPGSFKRVLVVRPSILTDGECVAERIQSGPEQDKGKKPYRVGEGDLRGWTVSRKDVAHFVVDAILNRWDEFENKCISIAY